MCSRSVAFVAFSDGKPVSTFPENALSRQPFRFGKRSIVGRCTLIGLGLDQLVEPARDEDRRVILAAAIFAVDFLGIQPKADDVALSAADRLQRRLRYGGVANLG